MNVGSVLFEQIPEGLFYPEMKADLIHWLQAQIAPTENKLECYRLWGYWVGMRFRASDLNQIEITGIDYQPGESTAVGLG